jgi:hypothetical protein
MPDHAEPRGRFRLDAVATQLLRQLHAAAKLGLGRCEVAPVHHDRRKPKVTLGSQRDVLDLLRGRDPGTEEVDGLGILPLEVRD